MKNNENIILIGGGGHCKACIDVIVATNQFSIMGIIDIQEKKGESLLGYPIIGDDEDIPMFLKDCKNFLITIGFIKSPLLRRKLFNKIKRLGGTFPVIISPSTHISPFTRIGEGTIVMHNTTINAGASIGHNCIINNHALVEHDVTIGNNTHVSTGAIVNGACNIGHNCFIGSGSIINQEISVESNTILGSGSLVIKNITIEGTYVGNPLRKLNR